MSLNQRKRQAEALFRSSWCNTVHFHNWVKQHVWTCTRCRSKGTPCTFSNFATTHCDSCTVIACSAKRDFRKAFFMHRFDITEELYESWVHEWNLRTRPGAVIAGPCSNSQAPPSPAKSSPGYSPDSPLLSPDCPSGYRGHSQSSPAQNALPAPVRDDQGAMVIAVNQLRLTMPSNGGRGVPITPTEQSADNDSEVRLTKGASVNPDQVRNGNDAPKRNSDNLPPHPAITDATPSIMQCLDNQIQFLNSFRTISEKQLKILTVQKCEQERAHAKEDEMDERIRMLEQKLEVSREAQEGTQVKEDEMKERICVLEQRLKGSQELQERAQAKDYEMTERIRVLEQQLKESQESSERLQASEHELKEQVWVLQQQRLRESQESQARARVKEDEVKERITALEQELKESQDSEESLRSRLKAIIQDLQIEVLRDEDENTKKRKREETEEGELVYPSHRPRPFN